MALAASAQIRSIIFKNAENFNSTFLKENTFVKENEESFEIFCFSWMESSKLINYSANMCQSRQGTSLRASPAVLSM